MKLSKFIENQTELVEAVIGDSLMKEQTINGNELSKFIAEISGCISNESLDLLEKQIAVIKKSNQYNTEVEEAFNKTFGDIKNLMCLAEDENNEKFTEIWKIYCRYSDSTEIGGIPGLTDGWDGFYKNPNIEFMNKELARLDKEIENFRKEFSKIVTDYKSLQKNESRL